MIGRIGGWLLDNFWLKLISLMFALGFYAFIHSAQNTQRTVAVPLVVEKPQSSLPRRLMSDIPGTVAVTVIGPRQQLESIDPERLSIALNLSAGESHEVRMLSSMINDLPPGVRVERINPRVIKAVFESVISRQLPIQVSRSGSPAEGMEVMGTLEVNPPVTTGMGIESAVSVIQFARADPFDITGLAAGTYTRRLRLHPPTEDVTLDPGAVDVTLTIAKRLEAVEFKDVKVEVLGLPLAVTVPATVNIKIVGSPDRVGSLRREALIPRIDPKSANIDITKPGSALLTVTVEAKDATITVEPRQVLLKW